MRKNRIFSLLLAAVTLVLLLGSCSQTANLAKLRGTWRGDGTLEYTEMEMEGELSEEMPSKTVEILHFAADGTGYMVCGGQKMEYTYVTLKDTLTIRFPEFAVGWRFEVKNDTLTVRNSEFQRIA